MADQQVSNTNQGQVTNKSGNVFSKIFEGVDRWFRGLLGKKPPAKKPPQAAELTQASEKEVTEDSVAQDIQKFKKVVGKLSGKVSESVGPTIEKSKASATQTAGQLIDAPFLKKIIRVFLIVFFLMITVFVGIRLFKEVGNSGGNDITLQETSPTPAPYIPYKPSIYADDPEILSLEEEINLIEKELSTSNLRESLLTPPKLDFEISF